MRKRSPPVRLLIRSATWRVLPDHENTATRALPAGAVPEASDAWAAAEGSAACTLAAVSEDASGIVPAPLDAGLSERGAAQPPMASEANAAAPVITPIFTNLLLSMDSMGLLSFPSCRVARSNPDPC